MVHEPPGEGDGAVQEGHVVSRHCRCAKRHHTEDLCVVLEMTPVEEDRARIVDAEWTCPPEEVFNTASML